MTTLSEFLTSAQCQFQAYDLGRKVVKIPKDEFRLVQLNRKAYPYPIQQQAYFAVTFWTVTETKTHFVWFVKIPIDEQGLLSRTAQAQFIKIIKEVLGSNIAVNLTQEQEKKLANNPFTFKPNLEKQAIFNAINNVAFARPPSSFYNDSVRYFSNETPWNEWQEIGIQGVADVSCRLNQDDNLANIIRAIPHLPEQPLQSLCLCLEHQTNLDSVLVKTLATQASMDLNNGYQDSAILLMRAASGAQDISLLENLFLQQLSSELMYEPYWYVGVSGRLWRIFENETLLNRFFEALASHHPQLFPQLFGDLVAIPLLRTKVLAQLRLSSRSPELSDAMGLLVSNITKAK